MFKIELGNTPCLHSTLATSTACTVSVTAADVRLRAAIGVAS